MFTTLLTGRYVKEGTLHCLKIFAKGLTLRYFTLALNLRSRICDLIPIPDEIKANSFFIK
jgi:hypothetical protein